MTRQITTHHSNALNRALTLEAIGEPGPGGANERYEITYAVPPNFTTLQHYPLSFQTGDPADGINGISNEVLLAIVADRLEGFQEGPFACETNEVALGKVKAAIRILGTRSQEREERGVEGKQCP